MKSKYIPSTQCMVAVVIENKSQDKFVPELLGWEAGQLMQEGRGVTDSFCPEGASLCIPSSLFILE